MAGIAAAGLQGVGGRECRYRGSFVRVTRGFQRAHRLRTAGRACFPYEGRAPGTQCVFLAGRVVYGMQANSFDVGCLVPFYVFQTQLLRRQEPGKLWPTLEGRVKELGENSRYR